jgi:hypothetical protein
VTAHVEYRLLRWHVHRQPHPRANKEGNKEGNEEATMLYLWGAGLDAEVDYRRTELGKMGTAPRRWWRQARRAVSTMGRERPNPW